MKNTTLFNQLNKVIFEAGLSTAELATKLGVSEKTVARWRSFSLSCPDIPARHLLKLEQMSAAMKATRKAQAT